MDRNSVVDTYAVENTHVGLGTVLVKLYQKPLDLHGKLEATSASLDNRN
jgi:hypothetical protein